METPFTPTLEQLLAHAPWARALARELVLDQARADDVVQQAWLAACERPPTPGPGLRVWLTRLIRNVARNQRRADARRAQHEELAAAPERSIEPPVPDVVSEFEAQQLVAQALLDLDEPYRQTLLRRWYRDEKPAAIARAMQLPVKTVETRLARGLERLRARLTELKGGDRHGWALLLVPLAKQAPGSVAAAAGGVVASAAAGVAAMTVTAKLIAAGVVAAATVATWVAVAPRRGGSDATGVSGPGRLAGAAAVGRSPDPAPAAAESPAVAASRTREETAAPAVKGSTVDRYATLRGAWHLHGRVVAKGSRAPIEGVDVSVMPVENGSIVSLPPLATAKSDAHGDFLLERLSEKIRVALHAPGFLSSNLALEADELLATPDAPPREFELEAPTFGALVATLQARDGREIPPAILRNAKVSYGPAEVTGDFFERFDRLPKPVLNGGTVDMAVAFERKDDRFVVDHVPAAVPVQLFARLDRSDIGRLLIDPLAAGETREVSIPIECGIVVGVRCVDAATGARIPLDDASSYPSLTMRWTGARAADHVTREIEATRDLQGSFTLPGPGHVAFAGEIDGFAPFTCEFDVVDGSALAIPLTRWRQLLVKVVTEAGVGLPRRKKVIELGETPTTHFAGMPFVKAGRAPDCLVVPAGDALPARLDPDAPSASNGLRTSAPSRVHLIGDGFKLFAPSQPLRVGIYDDGELVGSADVPATAPLLQPDEPPPAPPGPHGSIIPDPPLTKPVDLFGPTQTVTVAAKLPTPVDAELRFEAVGGDGNPAAHYEVHFSPLVDDKPDLLLEADYRVDDANRGLFHCTMVPAGDWQMRIRRGRTGVHVWSGAITVESGRVNDLGTLTLRDEAALEVRVVDEAGLPLADAEVRLVARPSGTPLEFAAYGRFGRTFARTDADGHPLRLDLAAQPVHVEASSAGYLAAGADVDVTAGAPASCTIVLRPSPTSSR